MRRAPLILVAVLAACSTPDGAANPAPATETTRSPEDAFTAAVDVRLESDDPHMAETALTLGEDACELLDSPHGSVPDTDHADLVLGVLFGTDLDDQVTAVIVQQAGVHLCPEHGPLIARYLTDAGWST
jgi:hypothetical protein